MKHETCSKKVGTGVINISDQIFGNISFHSVSILLLMIEIVGLHLFAAMGSFI
jgi:hypothetical protein